METLCFAYGNKVYTLSKQSVSIIETNCILWRNKVNTVNIV